MLLTTKTSSFKRISSRLILASVGRSNSKYLDCPSHAGYLLKQFHLISLKSLSVLIRALNWETLWELRIKWEVCQLWAEMSGKIFYILHFWRTSDKETLKSLLKILSFIETITYIAEFSCVSRSAFTSIILVSVLGHTNTIIHAGIAWTWTLYLHKKWGKEKC